MKTFLHSSKDKQSLSDWSLRQKAGFFVFLALFAICIGMACFFNGFSLPDLLILIAIAVCLYWFIYVLPISLHPVVKAVITIILPTAAFFLLESMTHVVWETMEIDAVLLNLVFYYLFFLFFLLRKRINKNLTWYSAYLHHDCRSGELFCYFVSLLTDSAMGSALSWNCSHCCKQLYLQHHLSCCSACSWLFRMYNTCRKM